MRNPRVTLVISLIGIAVIAGSMLFHGDEADSTTVTALQWIFLAGCVSGLVGSLIQLGTGKSN